MRHFTILAAVLVMAAGCAAQGAQKVILDTDLGNDVDDVLAIDIMHKFADEGRLQILAVMTNKDTPQAPELADILDTWYGRPEIPIGKVTGGVTGGSADDYALKVCSMTSEDGSPLFERNHSGDFPDAVTLYRQILSEQPDHSVVIVSTGFSTNLARLLASGPDRYSKLSGRDLVARKVSLVSCMAGGISNPDAREYNVVQDIPSAQELFKNCPVQVVMSPQELGQKIRYPASSISGDFDWGVEHPMVQCYVSYKQMPYDRQTWDLTSMLYVVEPEYFTVSEPGTIEVTDEGCTRFTPSESGQHRYISADDEQGRAILARFIEIITRKPASIK